MNHLKLIHQYLTQRGSIDGIPASGFPFLTIAREPGAGGHLLAHVILTDFLKQKDRALFDGWHVFDRELCQVVAEDPALQTSMESLLSEEHRSEFSDFVEGMLTGQTKQYRIDKLTLRVVRLLATLGKVIIVGRAGACVTRNMPGGIHIRLVAPLSLRIRWLTKKFKIDREEARRLITKQARDTRALVKEFFDHEVDDPLIYDAIWNTSRAGMQEISASVIEMIRQRHELAQAAGKEE
jgi:cytidylate kinase